MGGFHIEKKGIRIFGVSESFAGSDLRSVLAGVVMRRDFIIDGLIFGKTTVRGDDATEIIVSMFRRMKRNDINCILLGGTIISILNIVDGQELYNITKIPIIAVSCRETRGLSENNLRTFEDGHIKCKLYNSLGASEQLTLWTGKTVNFRNWGITSRDVSVLLNDLTLQGARPEPIKVARLAARAHRGMLNASNLD
ncbi:MAG: DUF99 family protein [Thermoproteota archaeon]|nr:DUF99 family protein [Thermoproteota archaeon]